MPFDDSKPIGPNNILWPSDMPVALRHEAEARISADERTRLQLAIVKAAKEWAYSSNSDSDRILNDAVAELVKFESALRKEE